MTDTLNRNAMQLADQIAAESDRLNVEVSHTDEGTRILDFGITAGGGLQAGVELARLCMSDLASVSLQSLQVDAVRRPFVCVHTDRPAAACLFSQYAGWQLRTDEFFGMGSGPMRSAAAREEMLSRLDYREDTSCAVGVIESSAIPDTDVCRYLADRCNIAPEQLTIAVAPTSSLAGTVQVVARSVETALHKLFELEFDVRRISSGFGSAPLPPVAADDLAGIGRTNDAILYGGTVHLWVRGDDTSIDTIGPKVPASSSDCYGKPFLEIFEDAGRDFYAIDPHLFSPAEIVFENLDTGRSRRFGRLNTAVLQTSFGM